MIARAVPVPLDALLQRYVGNGDTYTDAFEVMSPYAVDLEAFIEAFYTTWLFRLERWVLTLTLRRRIRDSDVVALASGADRFAAWRVEAREAGQILLCDHSGATRSWLAVSPKDGGATRLIFGSAVVAAEGKGLGRLVWLLIPLHRLYARALLRLAEQRLRFT
ncbi:hypothetical protein [Sulfitobacter aestuariivivens]|uniref:DUF2867 domain-containing protein n=1 Tax=Sulfitobacter aestuariivivens TaxID=2766981 RepID=A0A927D165_9RHOB|nr:hypothetical protein [Sulfitobacter aestuariivivens]MBD3663195.1 hypothetical protein [Sulfitobacter aestuariivivens]